MGSLALSACATDSARRAELTELKASVRALLADNGRLERRLERLERERVVAGVEPAPGAGAPRATLKGSAGAPATESASDEAGRGDRLPPLKVVRARPRRAAPPPVSTEVSIAEPSEGSIEAAEAAVAALGETAGETAGETTEAALEAAALFDRGVEALKTGNPEAGVARLLRFADERPKDPKADNALYFAGLGLMALGDLDGAIATFERSAARYPAGDALLDSLLKLGECRFRNKERREAKATWERIVAGFPGTAAASQAQSRLVALSAPTSSDPP